MRYGIITALIALLPAAPVFGQDTPQQKALFHTGSVKIWTGVALLAAGAVIIPITRGDKTPPTGAVTAGVASIFAGGTLIWLGGRDQQNAIKPSTLSASAWDKRFDSRCATPGSVADVRSSLV